ncbi:hypothetical protein N7U66_19120 [Lacinutrix neustonica]|uniref:Uncharacterized protein n=1 Tax=Lacinutrix neustonica TaxID=2980107 RepID=A0A9E8MVY1_9FLAO|nr:hypothetical protein [Lacinutrix neustonica]WAC01929.1 hypothetical protein N7U66_19120 [Lacinutrix neustonica]
MTLIKVSALNIVEGVTQIIEKHGKIIVLEDDIITSPQFLTYMNAALNYYEKEEKVMHISRIYATHRWHYTTIFLL